MTAQEIIIEVRKILSSAWKRSNGRDVPEVERLVLAGNHGIDIEAAVLYADMADSTALVDRYKDDFAAEMYKAYLLAACRAIRDEGGEITAFDGDRAMSVFVGDNKNSSAAKAGLKIHFIVNEVNKAIRAQYPSSTFTLAHCTGIDTGQLLVTKTGIRDYNDLVWVGSAANYAAKLSAINEAGYPTIITERVYKKLNEASKFGGDPKKDMWEKRSWTQTGQTIYRSNYWWAF